MRDWVDFSFTQDDVFYPVNIKVSTTKTADNLKMQTWNLLLGIPHYNMTNQ